MNINVSRLLGFNNREIPVRTILALVLGCFMLYFVLAYVTKSTIVEVQKEKLFEINQLSQTIIQKQIHESRTMVNFLHSTPPVIGLSRAILNDGFDVAAGNTTEQWRNHLETIMTAFLQTNPEIRQIRFIGKQDNGRELVRVENRSGLVSVVPLELLQEKGDSSYFSPIEKLKPNETYVSSISLNREYGVIDTPVWATYRVASPVFDDNYNFFGFIIINYDATVFLEKLKEGYRNADLSLYIIDSDGYFISAPRKSLEFGLDLENPQANWSAITQNSAMPKIDQISRIKIDGENSYAVASESNLVGIGTGKQYLVSVFSDSILDTLWKNQRQNAIYLVIAIFITLMIIIYGYQRYLNKLIKLYDDQSRYEAIVSGSSDSIINIDDHGRIISWNESASYMFGLNEKQSLGKRISDVIPTANKRNSLDRDVFENIIAKNSSDLLEIESRNSMGMKQILSISLSPVVPKDRSIRPTVAALIRDITESKENENKIISINDSLEQQVSERTEQLELATAEAVSANETKSAFLANISHEIRTPLNGVGGMLELLSRESLTNGQRSYVQMAKSSVLTLSVLINDLLDLTKIESGKLDIEMTELNLVEEVSSIIETMTLKAKEKGLTLLFDSTALEPELIISDPYRIKQILINLIGNAIKFTEQGYILVTVSSRQSANPRGFSFIDISVEDTGMGISLNEQKKLFQPFTQAQTSTARNYGGTGLGLSISKQLAALLDGEIKLKSIEHVGSTFTFSFKPEWVENKRPFIEFPNNIVIHCHIIMADTKEREILKKQLEKWGILVSEHNNVQSCLNIHEGEPIDIVVVDGDLIEGIFEKLYKKLETEIGCKLIVVGENQVCENKNISGKLPCSQISRPILPFQLYASYKRLRHPNEKFRHMSGNPDEQDIKGLSDTSYNVLIVDDNEINRFVAQGLLEKFPVKTYTANDGSEALAFLKDQKEIKIDLVLMDCQMPVLNGFDATRRIRDGDAGSAMINVPIVALTAGAMAGERDACISAGMNDFIAKPIDPTLFENKVFYWLNLKVDS